MKTIRKLNKDILKISMKIQYEYPELSMHLAEMPVTIPDMASPSISVTCLSDYYDSLQNILKKYKLKPKKVF